MTDEEGRLRGDQPATPQIRRRHPPGPERQCRAHDQSLSHRQVHGDRSSTTGTRAEGFVRTESGPWPSQAENRPQLPWPVQHVAQLLRAALLAHPQGPPRTPAAASPGTACTPARRTPRGTVEAFRHVSTSGPRARTRCKHSGPALGVAVCGGSLETSAGPPPCYSDVICAVWGIHLTGAPSSEACLGRSDLGELSPRPAPMTLSYRSCSAYMNSPLCSYAVVIC